MNESPPDKEKRLWLSLKSQMKVGLRGNVFHLYTRKNEDSVEEGSSEEHYYSG